MDAPTIDKIFPNDSYEEDEIYEIAHANYLLVDDTYIPGRRRSLEIIECLHERSDQDECREDWRSDEHETILEFRSEGYSRTYTKFA